MADEIMVLRQADPAAPADRRPLDARAGRELEALLARRTRVLPAFGGTHRRRPWLLAAVAAGQALVVVALPLVGVPGRGGPGVRRHPAAAARDPHLRGRRDSAEAARGARWEAGATCGRRAAAYPV